MGEFQEVSAKPCLWKSSGQSNLIKDDAPFAVEMLEFLVAIHMRSAFAPTAAHTARLCPMANYYQCTVTKLYALINTYTQITGQMDNSSSSSNSKKQHPRAVRNNYEGGVG